MKIIETYFVYYLGSFTTLYKLENGEWVIAVSNALFSSGLIPVPKEKAQKIINQTLDKAFN